jgi:predicted  nucleic acid-binding Zn-ribbon protein
MDNNKYNALERDIQTSINNYQRLSANVEESLKTLQNLSEIAKELKEKLTDDKVEELKSLGKQMDKFQEELNYLTIKILN